MASPGGTPQQQGLILQRGHTELLLDPLGDRLMVAFRSPDVDLLEIVPGLMYRPLPSGQKKLFFQEIFVPPEDFAISLKAARQHPDILFAYPVYQLADSLEGFVYLTQHLTLQFAPDVSPAAQKAIGDRHHLKQIRPIAGADQTFLYELTTKTDLDPLELSYHLQREPAINLAEPNVLLPLVVRETPFEDQPQGRHWYLEAIQAPAAWQITKGDRQTTIAVLAPDLDLGHGSGAAAAMATPDLCTAIPEISPTTPGNIAAQLAIDAAPECTLLLLQLPHYLDDDLLEQALAKAIAHGAAVILLGWQLAAINFPLSLRQSLALEQATTQGRQGKGCLLVTGAGDANRPLAGMVYERHWPNELCHGPTQWLDGKANHPAVMTVSACTGTNKKASYSNWGQGIGLCGPTYPAPPTLWLQEQGTIAIPPEIFDTQTDDGTDLENFPPGQTLEAAALVAGVAALIFSVKPQLTGWAVEAILRATAKKMIDPQGDRQLGLYLGTYDAQGHSQWFGYGRVDALAAVTLAQKTSLD
ncbi:S8 family serine peptidase [Synechococcus moorigangaii CMS01]|nr:S8 family serine peptidase [Synechococcus moorigangaii CMS01]